MSTERDYIIHNALLDVDQAAERLRQAMAMPNRIGPDTAAAIRAAATTIAASSQPCPPHQFEKVRAVAAAELQRISDLAYQHGMAHAPQLPPMPVPVREWLADQYPYPRPAYTDTREKQLPRKPVTHSDPQPAYASASDAHRPSYPYRPPAERNDIPLHMKDTMARALGMDYETGAPLPPPPDDANHTETCGIADCGYQAMGHTPAEAVANLTRHLDDSHSEGDPPWLRASTMAAAATQYASDVAIAWGQNETIPAPARQRAVALAQQAASYARMAAETMNRATSTVRASRQEQ